MLRSLFSGISGLRAHQQMMDVTANNIANVNTAGYKAGQATFQDTLSQTINSAGAPQAGKGGTNPAQIGLGVRLGGITTNFTQGAGQTTGRSTDLMIQGDGFFVAKDGNESLFTRSGSFSFDTSGHLVTNSGAMVQGWQADIAGNINTNAGIGPIQLPIGTLLQPQATTNAEFSGNLSGDAVVGTVITSGMPVYDTLGAASTLAATFTMMSTTAPPSATTWDISFDGGTTVADTLSFDTSGKMVTPAGGQVVGPNGVNVDLKNVTAYAGAATMAPQLQNGSAMGSLSAFTISPDGTLVGSFTNGLKQALGQLALASFNNPAGLEKAGESTYRTTVNSGQANLGTPGSAGRGVLQGQALEMSNVDLAQEFTNLVIAQRGFQANSRVITASDEILQDLVNIKR